MLLRVRIRELLSTALLEAPPNVNTSDQKSRGPMKGPRKFLGGHAPLAPPVETPLCKYIKVSSANFLYADTLSSLFTNHTISQIKSSFHYPLHIHKFSGVFNLVELLIGWGRGGYSLEKVWNYLVHFTVNALT